jgi:hypothetical protein
MKDFDFVEEVYNSKIHHHAEKKNGVDFRYIYILVGFELSIIRCEFRLISRFYIVSCF